MAWRVGVGQGAPETNTRAAASSPTPPRRTAAMLLAELLLVMAGHASSLFAVVEEEEEEEQQQPSSSSQQHGAAPWTWTMQLSNRVPYAHPGEQATLDALARLAAKARRIHLFATALHQAAQQHILRQGTCTPRGRRTHKQDGEEEAEAHAVQALMTPLAACMLRLLKGYHQAVFDTEADILQRSWGLVSVPREAETSSHKARPFVSLANIRSRFAEWDAPLTALDALVTTLLRGPSPTALHASASRRTPVRRDAERIHPPPPPPCPYWSSGQLLDLLSALRHTGVGRVQACMTALLRTVEGAWRQGLIAWMCEGESRPHVHNSYSRTAEPLVEWHDAGVQDRHHASYPASGGLSPSLGIVSNDPDVEEEHGGWKVNPHALPSWIGKDADTSGAILYVGRAFARVRAHASNKTNKATAWHEAENDGLPQALIATHRQLLRSDAARPCSRPLGFKRAVEQIRDDIAEWMWRHILTPDVILDAFDTL